MVDWHASQRGARFVSAIMPSIARCRRFWTIHTIALEELRVRLADLNPRARKFTTFHRIRGCQVAYAFPCSVARCCRNGGIARLSTSRGAMSTIRCTQWPKRDAGRAESRGVTALQAVHLRARSRTKIRYPRRLPAASATRAIRSSSKAHATYNEPRWATNREDSPVFLPRG